MTGEDVLQHLQKWCPAFEPTGAPVHLPEGNLNEVWRVRGRPASLIVKHAPPYVAAHPDIPLDPSRLLFEARALDTLSLEGRGARISTPVVRPPCLLDVRTDPHVLVMEDVGAHSTLGRWLQADGQRESAAQVGKQLGRFIGRLHARTYWDEKMAERFDNRSMQTTRRAVQYEGVAEMARRAGLADANALGARAEDLGQRLLEPGVCLTMGDLWPPSVLVVESGLRIIDWELAHFGRPMQDVAHFAAHGWMQAHRAPNERTARAVRALMASFWAAYRKGLGATAEDLLTDRERIDSAVHVGAEILVRTVGPFQEGYLYEGFPPDAPVVREAVEVAASHLRSPEHVDTLSALF